MRPTLLALLLCNTQGVTARALADARNHLSEVIDEVNRTHDRVTITRHGEPVAVVMAPADLEDLEETLEILAIPGALESIRAGEADLEAGRLGDWEALRQIYARDPA